MKKLFTAGLLAFSCGLFSQVGIGTTTPNAALEINSPSDDLPAIELNPQIAPIGSAAGQLSVIDGQLYLYDSTRVKWLSVESSAISFGREGSLNNINLEYSGDITNSDPVMPKDGTIVFTTFNSSGGNPTKGVTLTIYNTAGTVVSTHNLHLSSGELVRTDFNVDFSEGDSFRVRVDAGGGPSVNDLSMVLWVKWRKNNP